MMGGNMAGPLVKFFGEDVQTKRRIYRAKYPNGSIFEYQVDGFYAGQVEKDLPHRPGTAANTLQGLVKQGFGTEVRLAMKTIDKFISREAQAAPQVPAQSTNRDQIVNVLEENGLTFDAVQRMWYAADTIFLCMEHLQEFLVGGNEDPNEIAIDLIEFRRAVEALNQSIPLALHYFPEVAKEIKNIAYSEAPESIEPEPEPS